MVYGRIVPPGSRVLVAVDGSEDAALAARAAADISDRADAELHVVHAWHSVPTTRFETVVRTEFRREAESVLDEQVRRLVSAGSTVARAHLEEGALVDGILEVAGRLEARMLVVGSRGLGAFRRLALGSVSEGVVHHAASPVLVVRGGPEAWPPRRVLIGDDGSGAAMNAALLASAMAVSHGAGAILVRVYPRLPRTDDEGRRSDARRVDDDLRREEVDLLERAHDIEAALGSRPRVRIAAGDTVGCILEAVDARAPERTLIAVGSRGLGRVRRVSLGSVSTKVLRAAEGPVLVYPASPGPWMDPSRVTGGEVGASWRG